MHFNCQGRKFLAYNCIKRQAVEANFMKQMLSLLPSRAFVNICMFNFFANFCVKGTLKKL